MKNILLIFILGALVDLLAPSAMALAEEVAYDDVDYAALRLAGQSEQPQASDQVLLIYRQVLTFDENEYSASYNQDMLIASLTGGACVLSMLEEMGKQSFRLWADSSSILATEDLGYYEGSAKSSALAASNAHLSRARDKASDCTIDGLMALLWCLGVPTGGFQARVAVVRGLPVQIGAWVGRFIGNAGIGVLASLVSGTEILLCVLCVMVAIGKALYCYYYGVVTFQRATMKRGLL